MRTVPRLTGTLAVLALSMSGGCAESGERSGSTPRAEARHESREGGADNGPLVVAGGSGGGLALGLMGADAAPRAIFGGLLMCTTGGPVNLRAVDYNGAATTGPEVSVMPLVRAVPLASRREDPGNPYWAPLSATRGDLTRPSVQRRVPGTLTDQVDGYVVDLPCGEPNPGAARVELLTVMTAGRVGAQVDDLTLEYSSAGQTFRLDIPWTYTLCGLRPLPDC